VEDLQRNLPLWEVKKEGVPKLASLIRLLEGKFAGVKLILNNHSISGKLRKGQKKKGKVRNRFI